MRADLVTDLAGPQTITAEGIAPMLSLQVGDEIRVRAQWINEEEVTLTVVRLEISSDGVRWFASSNPDLA